MKTGSYFQSDRYQTVSFERQLSLRKGESKWEIKEKKIKKRRTSRRKERRTNSLNRIKKERANS